MGNLSDITTPASLAKSAGLLSWAVTQGYVTLAFSPDDSELISRAAGGEIWPYTDVRYCRVASLTRRALTPLSEEVAPVFFGNFRLDVTSKRLWYRDVEVPTRRKVFKLLYELASRPGVFQTHEELYGRVWGRYPDVFLIHHRKQLVVTVAEGRRCLEELEAGAAASIHTVHGGKGNGHLNGGYRFLSVYG